MNQHLRSALLRPVRPLSRFDTVGPDSAPAFCHRCGRQMDVVKIAHDSFDHETGEQWVHYHHRCPRHPRNAFQFFLRGNHTELCGPGLVAWA